jgi:hypothetical protein
MTLSYHLSEGGMAFRRGRGWHDIPMIVVRDHITIRETRRGDGRVFPGDHVILRGKHGPRRDAVDHDAAPEQRASDEGAQTPLMNTLRDGICLDKSVRQRTRTSSCFL